MPPPSYIMRNYLLYLLLFCSCWLRAQTATSPYQLTWATDAPIVGSGLVLGGVSIWLDARKPHLTEAAVLALKPQDVPRFDRFTTQLWSVPAQKTSDYFMYGAMALPFTLLLDEPMRRDFGTVAPIAAETFLATAALTALTKNIAQRNRPYTYNPNLSIAQRTDDDATASFFSGHTSISAAMSFMTAKMYSDYHPDSPAKPYIWAAAAAIPLVTAYLRVKGGKHFPSDVLVGYLVGAGLGILIPELHKKKQ